MKLSSEVLARSEAYYICDEVYGAFFYNDMHGKNMLVTSGFSRRFVVVD